jgi:hypothetical protein
LPAPASIAEGIARTYLENRSVRVVIAHVLTVRRNPDVFDGKLALVIGLFRSYRLLCDFAGFHPFSIFLASSQAAFVGREGPQRLIALLMNSNESDPEWKVNLAGA